MQQANSNQPIIGVGVLVWRDGKLLLGKRINKDKSICWQFPGGHLDPGEGVIDCATREVLEETSLRIKALRHLGFTDKPHQVGQRHYVTLLVSCEYESGEAQVCEPDKCAGWQWFDYPKMPSPLFVPITNFLDQQSDLFALHSAAMVLSDTPSSANK